MSTNEILLIFFAIPIAVIILSAIFETIINCPIKIAGIVFAIFLIVSFATIGSEGLIATIIYTILAYLTAWIVKRINHTDNKHQSLEDFILNNSEIITNSLNNNLNQENNNNQVINNNSNNCGRCNRFRSF